MTTLHPGTPGEAGMSPVRVAHIVDLAKGWVDEGITPALVILAARRGVIVLHEALGRMGPEPDAPPVAKDALFPLTSVSKPIVAAAVMALVDDGLLGPNRPVCWYIPEFVGEGKEEVTIHHLLTHTSGLRADVLDAHIEAKRGHVELPPPEPTEHPRIHEWLFLGYDAPLARPPGQEMLYSNYGYELLGEIVRRISGQPFPEFVAERIFRPLGMRDTTYAVPHDLLPRRIRRAEHEPWADHLQKTYGLPSACGGAWSTALDAAIFGQLFLNGGSYGDARVLSRASVAAMTHNQIPQISSHYRREFFPEASWSYGWSICAGKRCLIDGEPLLSPQAFCHVGLGATTLWVDPTYDLVGVYLSVLSNGGIPEGVAMPQESNYLGARIDLLINAVMAAIVD